MAGGHMTKVPATIAYVSVMSIKTVRIALMIAALNNLEVKLGDILNVFVQVPIIEKVWTTLSPELSKDISKTAVIVRALYDLK